ncbi:unnamed protein product [[Candida] boidinii]|nr:unnamed protein product [[Candida] boidinii]GMF66638.1 unnamed protein product [[Candida] boidinii]
MILSLFLLALIVSELFEVVDDAGDVDFLSDFLLLSNEEFVFAFKVESESDPEPEADSDSCSLRDSFKISMNSSSFKFFKISKPMGQISLISTPGNLTINENAK